MNNFLMIALEGIPSTDVESVARETYERLYVPDGMFGLLRTDDEEVVKFYRNRFDHAFFTAKQSRQKGHVKDRIDLERIKRMPWIKEIVTGKMDADVWEVPGRFSRIWKTNRLYVVWSKMYVVWLEPADHGGFIFSSAYPTSRSDVKRYTDGGKLLRSITV